MPVELKEAVMEGSSPSSGKKRKINCDFCGVHISKKNIGRHKAEKHHAQENYLFQCSVEGCTFSSPRGHNLLRHQNAIHQGQKVAISPLLEVMGGESEVISPEVVPETPSPALALPSADTQSFNREGSQASTDDIPVVIKSPEGVLKLPTPFPKRPVMREAAVSAIPATKPATKKPEASQAKKMTRALTLITITKPTGQQCQIRASTGGLVTVPRTVPLSVVDLTHLATDPRRRAYLDAEKQKRALEVKAQRVGAALQSTTAKQPPSWKAARGLRSVQLMLEDKEGRHQLGALLAKKGLQLQPIPGVAPTPVQVKYQKGTWEVALPTTGSTWQLTLKQNPVPGIAPEAEAQPEAAKPSHEARGGPLQEEKRKASLLTEQELMLRTSLSSSSSTCSS